MGSIASIDNGGIITHCDDRCQIGPVEFEGQLDWMFPDEKITGYFCCDSLQAT